MTYHSPMDLSRLTSEPARAYFYRLALAVIAALVLYGVLAPGDIPVWAEIVAALLGLGSAGLATGNTSTKG